MAVVEKDALLERVRAYFADKTGDEEISILEDVSDTMEDYHTRATDPEDWKGKYEQNDREWRQRYMDRFGGKTGATEDKEEILEESSEEVVTEPTRYEDLFTEVKE